MMQPEVYRCMTVQWGLTQVWCFDFIYFLPFFPSLSLSLSPSLFLYISIFFSIFLSQPLSLSFFSFSLSFSRSRSRSLSQPLSRFLSLSFYLYFSQTHKFTLSSLQDAYTAVIFLLFCFRKKNSSKSLPEKRTNRTGKL